MSAEPIGIVALAMAKSSSSSIAEEYNPSKTYEDGDFAMFDGVLKVYDGSAWSETTCAENFGKGGGSSTPVIKTTMDSVAQPGVWYYLGTQSTVNVTLPVSADVGKEIVVAFYSGSTAAPLIISGAFVGTIPIIEANNHCEMNFAWDGTNWIMAYVVQKVV